MRRVAARDTVEFDFLAGWQLRACEHRFLTSKPTREGNAPLFSNLKLKGIWLKRCTRDVRWKRKGKEEEL
jgi:hypothetical protein